MSPNSLNFIIATMKAIVYRKHGPPSVLELVKDWPVPSPRKGEVLVRMKATSVNPVDFQMRSGMNIIKFVCKLPKVRCLVCRWRKMRELSVLQSEPEPGTETMVQGSAIVLSRCRRRFPVEM